MSTREKNYITTGEAAAIFDVDPDTVLRWIKSGDIPAIRTPGGHYRIHRSVFLAKIIEETGPEEKKTRQTVLPYCWEYNSEAGRIREACKGCIVYRSRASRCYELSKIDLPIGHAKLFCTESCQDCAYFKNIVPMTG